MRLNLNLTKDEFEWLENVTNYGAEVTKYLKRRISLFKDGKDWDEIQFGLYEKIGRVKDGTSSK